MSESDDLLQEWYMWWRETEVAPPKMPDGLHIRTAVYLKMKELEVGHAD